MESTNSHKTRIGSFAIIIIGTSETVCWKGKGWIVWKSWIVKWEVMASIVGGDKFEKEWKWMIWKCLIIMDLSDIHKYKMESRVENTTQCPKNV